MAAKIKRIKDKTGWEPYDPPYDSCDLCNRIPSWKHPEGGFRCDECLSYAEPSFKRKLSGFRIKWTQQWFEKIWDEVEDYSPADYKLVKKKIRILKCSSGARDIRFFRIYKKNKIK